MNVDTDNVMPLKGKMRTLSVFALAAIAPPAAPMMLPEIVPLTQTSPVIVPPFEMFPAKVLRFSMRMPSGKL